MPSFSVVSIMAFRGPTLTPDMFFYGVATSTSFLSVKSSTDLPLTSAVFWIIELRMLRLLTASERRLVPKIVREDDCGESI